MAAPATVSGELCWHMPLSSLGLEKMGRPNNALNRKPGDLPEGSPSRIAGRDQDGGRPAMVTFTVAGQLYPSMYRNREASPAFYA